MMLLNMSLSLSGSYRFFKEVLSNYGIETTFINMTDLKVLEDSIKPNTKVSIISIEGDNISPLSFPSLLPLSLSLSLPLPSLQMLWVESLTNPLLRYTDLEAVVKIAKKREVFA